MISSALVDDFGARLTSEMSALSPAERAELIARIDLMDVRMRASGQERPIWRGPASVPEVLGRELTIETDHGTRIGRAICFGIVPVGFQFERSVIVHVPASGTQFEVPGSQARLADQSDLARKTNEERMSYRLAIAASSPSVPVSRRPARLGQRIKNDPKLIERLLGLAMSSPNVQLPIEEGIACHKIRATIGSRRIYLFRSQMRCNLGGFTLAHPAVRSLTPAEAHGMHLGSVRGQINFEDPAMAEVAFALALEELNKEEKERE